MKHVIARNEAAWRKLLDGGQTFRSVHLCGLHHTCHHARRFTTTSICGHGTARWSASITRSTSNAANIALVTSALQNWAGRERKRAFLRAYKESEVSADRATIRTMESPADFGLFESLELLSSPNPPTAMIARVQELIGLLRAVRSRGMNIPNDISIITLGDSDLAELMQPAVSAVRWDSNELGRGGANLLLQRIADPDQVSRKVLLPTEFVSRASCAPPRVA